MMAKKPDRAISEQPKGTPIPTQNIKKKRITTHLSDRKTTGSLKNSSITKLFPAERAEEALRENEKRLQALMDASPIGISWADMEGNIKYNNRKFRQLFGYTVDDIPTIAEWRRLAYPDPAYRETVPSLVAKLTEAQKQGREVTPIEVTITCKDGSTRCVEQMGAFASNQILAIYNDLTEHKLAEEALRESEEKYRTILEEMEEGYFETDLAGNLTFINDAGCRNLGYPREELIGKGNRQYADAENAKKVFQAFNKLYGTGEPCRVLDYETTRKDGTKAINELSVSLMRNQEGKPIGFRGISHHITERKKMEEVLRQSEERYRTILENMQEVYYEIDLAGNWIFLNEAFYKHLGYAKEEMIGKKSRQYQDETTARELYQAYARLYETGEPIRAVEAVWISKDGSKRTYEMSASLITDPEGKPVGFRGVSRDVTERKKAEEALRHSEEKYRNIIESIEEGYYEEDLAGNLTFFNDSLCRIYGYPKEELLGLNYKKYTSEETAKKLFQIFNEMYRTGNTCKEYSCELIRKDGVKRYIEASASLKRDPSGKPIGFRGVVRDVTERKKSDEKFTNLVTHAPIGLSTLNNAGTYEYVNPKFTEIFGYTLEDIPTGKIWFEKAHPDPKYRRMVIDTWKGDLGPAKAGTPPARVFTVTCKDGSIKEILFKHVVLTDESHLVAYEDITDLKQAEEALRESEEKYRTLLENMAEGYFEVDLAGNLTFVNDAECVVLGYSRQELIGMNNRQYTDKETAKKMFEAFNRLHTTGEPVKRLEEEVIRKDGTRAIRELSATLIRDSAGKPLGFRATSRDITERKRSEEAQRQSEERYRTIIENIQDGYFEVDLAGNFTFVNDAECVILGYSRDELIGMNNRQYTDKENAKKLFQAFNKLYKTGEPVHGLDLEVIRKDGTKAFDELSVSLIRDSEGKPVGFRGIARDVTERKRAEEALRHSEERYRTILESIQEGYFETDLDGNYTFVNDANCRYLGYTREELIGMNYRQHTEEKIVGRLYPHYRELYRTGKPIESLQFEALRKDGTKVIYETSVTLMRDSKGKPIGVRGVSRDITERKRAEEALRHSEERYRTIIESIEDGYYEEDLAGNFDFFNESMCRIYGYPKEELLGLNYKQYTDEETAKKLFQVFNEMYRTGNPCNEYSYELIRKDGAKRYIEASASLKRDPSGKPIGFRGVVRDITERKQAEEEKLSLQEQLRQSQKMEAIGQLAGGVAHDFNNLLTVIKGYSQLSLFDLKENDPLRGNIQEIEKATQRATDLTRQLLAFSRRQILDFKVLDLNALLKDLEKMLRRIIGEDIELVTLSSEDLGRVKIDPSQIEQVIFNLAVNARDAMPSGGKLTVETANVELDEVYAHAHVGVIPGRYVSLSVSDTGVGMSQEVKEKVFEPFFTTKAKGKGTGLGLSMVYGIVKQSNGNIWIYSEPGRGTTFKINLPRIEEALDTLRGRDETDFFPGGNETVLLVEDDELVRDLAYRLLKQQGYRVLVAVNGEEALGVVREHDGETIHLLLADIVMPLMGGKELADKLKIFRPDVKVLYTSGYADDAIVHHGVLDPGTYFLQKPFSLKTLSNKVREVLDG